MRSQRSAYLVLSAVVLLSGVSFFWQAPVELIRALIGENIALGSVIFVGLMFIATVIAPVTVLPLVPLVAPVLGPFLTGTLSIIGWELGAIVAFLIARHAGRPVLERFVSLRGLGRYESYVPKNARFFLIVTLRMMLPVDVLSYALGLFSRVPLSEYAFATLVGITWFAYAFAFLGQAALQKNYVFFIILGVASIFVLGLSSFYVVQQVRKDHKKSL